MNGIAVSINKYTNAHHFPRKIKFKFLSLLQYLCGLYYKICAFTLILKRKIMITSTKYSKKNPC